MNLPVTEDFRQLILNDTPLLDVRAPVEYLEGAFPLAANLPLVNDEERHLIGIQYKEEGQDAAIELGLKLVAGEEKARRISAWNDWIECHPGAVLYCFRGGKRSQISQRWIQEITGKTITRVKGGYKALRRFLIEEIDVSAQTIKPFVLGGRTGSGKTLLLKQLPRHVDLERLAWHRGSAFGGHARPQPTQINFENALAIDLIKLRAQGSRPIIFEDESRNVGSRHIPPVLYEHLAKAPLIILNVSDDARIRNSVDEYVHAALAEYQEIHGEEEGFRLWSDYLLGSLARISKRLGGARYTAIRSLMNNAINDFAVTGNDQQHEDWVRSLLLDYYDPMYDYQISRKSERVVFSGTPLEIMGYMENI